MHTRPLNIEEYNVCPANIEQLFKTKQEQPNCSSLLYELVTKEQL